MRIPLCDLLVSTPSLRYVFESLEAANRRQTSVDEVLRDIAYFGGHTQEEITKSLQGAGNSSKIRRLTAAVRRLRGLLEELDVHCYHLHIQLCCMSYSLDHKELKPSAFVAEYYCMTNEHYLHSSDSDYESGTKRERAPDYYEGFPF